MNYRSVAYPRETRENRVLGVNRLTSSETGCPQLLLFLIYVWHLPKHEMTKR
jgi:hypothetical protein